MPLGPISTAIQSAPLPGASTASGTNLASVNGLIRQTRQQLDDWTTCVSAKTTKGQAEIQRLSAQLSGAENRAQRLAALQPQAPPTAPSRSVDVWA
jgi:hypothetical protein